MMEKYFRLTPIEKMHKNRHGCYYWKFKCDCGNETVVRMNSVKAGEIKSCGCLAIEKKKSNRSRLTHGMYGTRTYKSWANMKERCSNPKNIEYHLYGGRGISFCEKWITFEGFFEDMGERPLKTSIDRIDNDGNYCKENCRWATVKEQSNNRRSNHVVEFNGNKKTLALICEDLKIDRRIINQRIKRDLWSVEKALTTPIIRKNL